MSDDDIDRAVKEAAEFEAADKKRKEAVDTKNEADAIVFPDRKGIKRMLGIRSTQPENPR